MKFTKEEAVKALTAKMTETGEALPLSERTIGAHVDTLMRFIGEDVELDTFVDDFLPDFKTLAGQMRKDNSDFIKKWEEEHPIKTEPKKVDKGSNDSKSEYEKALEARLAALEAKSLESERLQKVATKKNELIEAMKTKGLKDQEWAEAMLSEVSITEDMDVNEKADAFVKIYNKSRASVEPTKTPKGAGGKPNDYHTMFDDIKKAQETKPTN